MNLLVHIFASCCHAATTWHNRRTRVLRRAAGVMGIAVVMAVSGCATLWLPPERGGTASPGRPGTPDRLDELMIAVDRFNDLSTGERQQELTRAEKRYRQHQTAYNLIQLALLTVMDDPGHGDTDQIRAGLRNHIKQHRGDVPADDLVPLAVFLTHVLDQRDLLMEENDTLQKKLDELKAIEQKLNEQNKREMIQVPP
jgi:hypothetical protein